MSVGDAWKDRRISLGKSVEDISVELRFGSKYIEAMEACNFEGWPARVFSQGFIRSYAALLGVDPEPMLDVYQAQQSEDTVPAEFPVTTPLPLWRADEKGKGRRSVWYGSLAFIVLIAAGAVSYVSRCQDAPPAAPIVVPREKAAPAVLVPPPAAAPATDNVAVPPADNAAPAAKGAAAIAPAGTPSIASPAARVAAPAARPLPGTVPVPPDASRGIVVWTRKAPPAGAVPVPVSGAAGPKSATASAVPKPTVPPPAVKSATAPPAAGPVAGSAAAKSPTPPAATKPAVPPPAAKPAVPPPAANPAVPPPAAKGAAAAPVAKPLPGAAAESYSAVPASGPYDLLLEVSEETWVSWSADGGKSSQVVLKPGARVNIPARTRILLKIGNAGGVVPTLNGKRIAPFGKAGTVRTVRFGPPEPASPKPATASPSPSPTDGP